MYTVCGATGNIGRVIAENLLKQGEKVRVIGRSAERLQALADKGAQVAIADMTDTEATAKAFEGTDVLFAMIPPNLTATKYREFQNTVSEAITEGIKKTGIKYVVNLSSVGAHQSDGVGPISGLHDHEQRLNKLEGTNILHLRPASFMENHLWQVQTAKVNGMMATPQDLERKIPQITTTDIANYATKRMTAQDFTGSDKQYLLGPEDKSMIDVATAIGQEIGNPDLKYVQISFEDTRNHMLGAGLSEDATDKMIELYKAIDAGLCDPTETRSETNTTPTPITEFAKTFAAIYKS